MGGARALIASLGASFSLVAGAALSLLVVSFVFAYDGFTGAVDLPPPASALVLESDSAEAPPAGTTVRGATTPVVIRPAPAATPAKRSESRAPRSQPDRTPTPTPAFNPRVRDLQPHAPDPSALGAPAARLPAVGDGVRDVGDAVSATVQDTGKSAAEVTAPLLGPPVAQAVQDVLDLLTSVLKGATGALGGVVDTALPRR
jgi:hypothetical protein